MRSNLIDRFDSRNEGTVQGESKPYENLSDAELLAGIGDGDELAFETLYDRYSASLYAVCLRILRHDLEAREVLSEVFLEVWEKASFYDRKKGSIRTFLSMIARCRAIDRLRSISSKRYSQSRLSELWDLACNRVSTSSPHEAIERSEDIDHLRDAMHRLSDIQREALCLAYFDGLTHVEISESLNVPLGTAKTAIRRGIAILREFFDCVSSGDVEP